MRRFDSGAGALLLAAGLIASVGPGRAQVIAPTKDLYTGSSVLSEGIRLGGWGSGAAVEDRSVRLTGDASIRLETNGYYAGGRIIFETPRDVTAQKNDPYAFLEFVARFQPGRRRQQQPMGYPGGYPGNFEGSSSDLPVSGSSTEGYGYPGGFPGFSPGTPPQNLRPETQKLKIVLICEEGTFVASNFPLYLLPAREEGWFSVAIPFVAFKGIDRAATARVREIRIFGDARDTFWIGEIRTTTDDEPISVEPLEDMEVSVGDAVEFVAQATGGISPLEYIWDFDFSDGLQEDAKGQRVIHVFRRASPEVRGKPGELQPFVVTLTVRDLGGAKKPVRRTINVIVNP